ncbi:MAG: arsenate reductase ArsC [Bacteroidetes bacterium]|nr:arsenate reductase ArsC [Bacteroidota bacterium]
MEEKKKVLIICTGNSCRSQMAEGFLRSFGNETEIISAGTRPEKAVNPLAVKVMAECDIDISTHYPKLVDNFVDQEWDFVITVCGGANAACPVFSGKVKQRIHIGFNDPADAKGTEEERLAVYRQIRDEIEEAFYSFYLAYISPKQMSSGCGCGCGCSN